MTAKICPLRYWTFSSLFLLQAKYTHLFLQGILPASFIPTAFSLKPRMWGNAQSGLDMVPTDLGTCAGESHIFCPAHNHTPTVEGQDNYSKYPHSEIGGMRETHGGHSSPANLNPTGQTFWGLLPGIGKVPWLLCSGPASWEKVSYPVILLKPGSDFWKSPFSIILSGHIWSGQWQYVLFGMSSSLSLLPALSGLESQICVLK